MKMNDYLERIRQSKMEPSVVILACVVAGVTTAAEIQRRASRLYPSLSVQEVQKTLYMLLEDNSVAKVSEENGSNPTWCLPQEAEAIHAARCSQPRGDSLKDLIVAVLQEGPLTARDLTKKLKVDKTPINQTLYAGQGTIFLKGENNLWMIKP